TLMSWPTSKSRTYPTPCTSACAAMRGSTTARSATLPWRPSNARWLATNGTNASRRGLPPTLGLPQLRWWRRCVNSAHVSSRDPFRDRCLRCHGVSPAHAPWPGIRTPHRGGVPSCPSSAGCRGAVGLEECLAEREDQGAPRPVGSRRPHRLASRPHSAHRPLTGSLETPTQRQCLRRPLRRRVQVVQGAPPHCGWSFVQSSRSGNRCAEHPVGLVENRLPHVATRRMRHDCAAPGKTE